VKRAWIAVALGFALGACDRTHTDPHFGVAERNAFRAQVNNPNAGNVTKPDQPLDPEEAAVIAHTYLKSLAPPNASDNGPSQSPVLVVPAPQPAGAPPPAPGQYR
jgi:hypothetical protein